MIYSELICSFCQNYLHEPYTTSCGHTFCKKCLDKQKQDQIFECPECHKRIQHSQNKPSTRIIQDMLTRILVTCEFCQENGIQKDKLDEHYEQSCLKKIVCCLAADVLCSWQGLREELDEHVNTCPYYLLNSILKKLLNENERLKEQLKIYENKHLDKKKELKNINIEFEECFQLFHEHLNTNENDIRENNFSIQRLDKQADLLADKINQCAQNERKIQVLTKKIESLRSMILKQNDLLTANRLIDDNNVENWDLSNSYLRDLGVQYLCDILTKTNMNLTSLKLESNEITDKGVRYLAKILENNRTLKILSLKNNQISNEGVRIIINALIKSNTPLYELILDGNQLIDDGSIESFNQLIKTSRTLKNLSINQCNLSVDGLVQFEVLK